tara:strand:+ start:3899 stop:4486 length:588 start_codon:yes stop_codon:yes gene_type:complete
MVWPFSNNQQPAQTGAMNLGLPGAQQQVPMQGMQGQQQWGQQQTPWGQQQYQAPPSEMDIISALITSNPLIDRWLASDTNFQPLISLMSSVVAVSVHTMLASARLIEDGDGYKFDFSGVQGLPTADSVTMSKTQIQNNSSNVVQQNQMQVQQMVAMANQGNMQSMLDGALADPGMMQNVGGGLGSLVRGLATGGR